MTTEFTAQQRSTLRFYARRMGVVVGGAEQTTEALVDAMFAKDGDRALFDAEAEGDGRTPGSADWCEDVMTWFECSVLA